MGLEPVTYIMMTQWISDSSQASIISLSEVLISNIINIALLYYIFSGETKMICHWWIYSFKILYVNTSLSHF